LVGPTGFCCPAAGMEKQQNAASHGNFLEQWSHAPLLQCSALFFFF